MITPFVKQRIHLLHELGGMCLFLKKIIYLFFKDRTSWRSILNQIFFVFSQSLGIVIVSGIFVGSILVLQLHLILSKYNAESLLGGLNTSTIIREIGPLVISFLLAGKVGAYTAAELATMRVTEQIDAIECLGMHPIQYLVIPRCVGIFISSILLLVVGLIVSVIGGIGIAHLFCGVNELAFISSIPRFTSLWTLFGGVFQSALYGAIVAIVSCYYGFYAQGGARGVGRAVTAAAVYTHFYILLANFITVYFLEYLEGLFDFLRLKGIL